MEPEEVIRVLNRRQHLKAAGVLAAIIFALGVMVAAVSVMYSGGPKPVPAAPK
jgi:hypothetical protein